MLVTVGDQPSLFEAVLPPELLRLPEELARIDELLDDPVFFEPFEPFFDPRLGRPSTPMETYLRLMFLKFRYGFGFETLCREVGDSITWRRFCRIPLEARMPHPTTLMKLTTRCGSAAVAGLNEALLGKAPRRGCCAPPSARRHHGGPSQRLLPDRLGAVGQGDPTDRGHRAADPGRRWRDPDSGPGSLAGGGEAGPPIGAKLRSRSAAGRDEALAAVRRTTGDLADLAETAVVTRSGCWSTPSARCAGHAPRPRAAKAEGLANDAAAGRRRGRLARAVNDLEELLAATRQIAAQTRQRLTGQTPMVPPGGSACTTPTPARSPRAGWANRSSSATRPRSSTTTTGSSSTTTSSPVTPPTHPSSRPPSTGERARRPSAAHRHRRPWLRRETSRRRPPRPRRPTVVIPRKGKPSAARRATNTKSLPRNHEVANRSRGKDQHPQTRIRLGPDQDRRHRRRPHLGRLRRPGTQPDQDQRPHRLKRAQMDTADPAHRPHALSSEHRHPRCRTPSAAVSVFQVEVARSMHAV